MIDPTADGSDATRFGAEDVARMQRRRDGSRRPVLAYLSIGEAEDYRAYWRPEWSSAPPPWLGPENPDWEGNYKVRYWDDAWRDLVLAALARIAEAGFDGVYLDIVDAYWYWAEEDPLADRVPIRRTADRMIALVEAIARAAPEGFLVVPQNGEFVVEDVEDQTRKAAYFAAIDGIGIEDAFFRSDADDPGEDAPWNPDLDRLTLLAEYRRQGKFVLSIEYLTDRPAIDRYVEEARARGFTPFAGRRPLDGIPAYPEPRR